MNKNKIIAFHNEATTLQIGTSKVYTLDGKSHYVDSKQLSSQYFLANFRNNLKLSEQLIVTLQPMGVRLKTYVPYVFSEYIKFNPDVTSKELLLIWKELKASIIKAGGSTNDTMNAKLTFDHLLLEFQHKKRNLTGAVDSVFFE